MMETLTDNITENLDTLVEQINSSQPTSLDLVDLLPSEIHKVTLDFFFLIYSYLWSKSFDKDYFKLTMSIPLQEQENPFAIPEEYVLNEDSTPTVTILPRSYDMLHEHVEEYRVPIKLTGNISQLSGVIGSFRSVRKREAIQNNWEYSQYLTLQHFPRDLMV